MSSVVPVIMAGGSGSRLWPLSRELYPKQFLKLDGEFTMLQTTVQRLDELSAESPLVICNEDHRFLVAEQLRQLGKLTRNIILEPTGRNTAPAIALAALTAIQTVEDGEDPLLLILAADHVIRDEKVFTDVVRQAIPHADAGKLVTFGIVPTHAETGYGYIRRGTEQKGAFAVAQFVEKPDSITAEQYLQSGEYYWNSGMFLFRASRFLEELKTFRPDIYSACSAAVGTVNPDLDFVRVNKSAFLACPSESIDYAVMEQTADAVVVPMSAGWSDVGSWSSLWDISEKDNNSNVFRGDVLQYNSNSNFVYAENSLVSLVGVENLVVVQTKDAVLVVDKSQVQDVKKIVESLKNSGRLEHRLHREVYRPWGRYDAIDQGERYQVKRITVRPGESLSTQMHHHRAEHWIVVAGTARVTQGNKSFLVTENESTYIPVGVVHTLENPGKVPLELLEIQSGVYLGDDDVVRLSDRYGRVETEKNE
ncbi:mannose-1-phosphate guanylyltransferase/mannose-6-phosphate isomerase [Xenorhabdus bovienii]|uniref:mannose-1-phosphate guanylyltransferase/mannose-6-phosphate isomerase n=1 Tax=Xenorhabdus bovienii TaxID=40576 RepID=UPI0023B30B93|nr:mannose-1-phosphate guanylyltransferase/mannose-6-phosphate isomerase [Xenorhabdus bovienii]MDE9534058.1 mannose-1-phosphate guanylyltransferase/mannose-6-phosphate isomerase [Xenorhabdus bovienii]MDE9586987.1 mannose-1-phosphate guanylyltransferase/mannose-6-phosphate isomerase [Xenorhabdus bovienii]